MSELTDLYRDVARCQGCDLAKTRTKVVPGEGPENATLLFIGEAPGYNEDIQGRPFVGQAGSFLEQLLASINLHRRDVYICNVIKCRPPRNADPLPTQIAACASWLDRQLALIKPRMIVTLGRFSMAKFFPGESIGKIHGVARKNDATIYFPMYHPAAALHQPSYRKAIEEDMKKIPALLLEAEKEIEELKKVAEKPQQLSLF